MAYQINNNKDKYGAAKWLGGGFGWLLGCVTMLWPHLTFSQTSVLSKGVWYKIATTQTGVYKIDAGLLTRAGIDLTKVNPQNIKLFGNGGALLPQPNATARPQDLTENAIEVAGEADGRFDAGDYILFYAESPHTISYDTTAKRLKHQHNYYSDSTFYFLTIADTKGLRVSNASLTASDKSVTSFDDFQVHELNQKNMISSGAKELSGSGREWYGEAFGVSTELSFSQTIEGLLPDSPVLIVSSAVAAAYTQTQLSLQLNGTLLGSHTFGAIRAGQYDEKGVYDLKGIENTRTFNGSASNGNTLKLTYSFNKGGQSSAVAYLNYFEIKSKRALQFYSGQVQARVLESLSNEATNFRVAQANAQARIWDVSQPLAPQNIAFTLNGSEGSFGIQTAGLPKTFALFSGNNLLTPHSIQPLANQNLHATAVPDMLIITLPDWRQQAERLAEFRRNHDGLSVAVANINEVYNEFASGKPDPTAIRDFARLLWLKDPARFKYILLFADATYDYKNNNRFAYVDTRMYIPTYESRESLNPVMTFSSDDYFGFLENNEGEWAENSQGNHTLDVSIGRLPAKSPEEAKGVVDKLIYYAQNAKTFGRWRGKVSFVADDGDANVHQSDADQIATLLENQDKNLVINKIYVDAFRQVSTSSGTIAPDVNKAINKTVNEGSLIVNYSGHGGPDGWTEEKILTIDQIEAWRNLNNMPLFLTATCSFGRFDDPSVVSGAEIALLSAGGGAIGLLTTTRPVFSYTNFLLNNAFYSAFVLQKESGNTRLGDIFRITKNNSVLSVNNRNFSLLGDPSMRLAYPTDKIAVTRINGQYPDGQVLKALAKASIEGEVRDAATNQLKNNFNGTVVVSVFDKPSTLSTLGQKTNKFNYQLYQNKIFEGKATVKNGVFAVNFVVPKDINYQLGQGKITCYAVQADSSNDAIGSFGKVMVGGSEPVVAIDTKGPEIELFVDKNNVLEARISDENGINVSQAGIGHEMLLTLNDTLQVIVNQYFISSEDYTKGILKYAFGKLPTGVFTVKLKIWDTYNNSTEVSLKFIVENEKFRLIKAYNYPNPFQEATSFLIEHNAEGEDIAFGIRVFDKLGKPVFEKSEMCYACQKTINIGMNIDFKDMAIGTYFYRIDAVLLSNNTKTYTSGKLVFWK
ncbi:type IX secretion system sortase PorU [Emticicia sp. 17c]|uniref:type IX secretion system sortase PorU n=1 Tax=Emticicia sp. 17c TaxID=3127704 RepID=UPI00301CBE3C